MDKKEFYVSITPKQIVEHLKAVEITDIEHVEVHELPYGKQMCVMIFERYFFRTSNQATCTLIAQNFNEKTLVRLVATGTSQGLFLKLDWGASSSFVSSIAKSLSPFIIG